MHARTRSRVLVAEEESCSGSDTCDTRSKIKLRNIARYFNKAAVGLTKDLARTVKSHQTNMMKIILGKLNDHIDEIAACWPTASDLELYMAFKKNNADTDDTVSALVELDFKESIKKEAASIRSPWSEDKPKSRQTKEVKKRSCGSFIEKPDDVDSDVWSNWSEARRISYLLREENPNTYYYRNLQLGETQKQGRWSEGEKELFLERLREMRESGVAEGLWGIFSMAIPGRVGYQCSNFYRKLIQEGDLTDPSYSIDEEGCLRYRNRTSYAKSANVKAKGKKPVPLSRYDTLAKENPLKGCIDLITGSQMMVPVISPDGNVLDYNTWMKILSDSKIDPFTSNPVGKRQLVILTTSNINEYRDLIRNM